MSLSLSEAMRKLKTPEGQKFFRYSVASAVAVIVSLICLGIFNGVFDWAAWISAILATSIATVPNFQMNRRWAWGKSGKSHAMKEVLPFWVIAFIGLGFSTLCTNWAEIYAKHHHFSHLAKTATVEVVYFAAFGVLWVAKFIIFNKILFAHHPEKLPEALDGRSGVPL